MQAAAAEVMENLMKTGENLPAPTTERQLRPLTGVSAKIQVEAWRLAQSLSGGRKVTGQHVEMALKQLIGRDAQNEPHHSSWRRDPSEGRAWGEGMMGPCSTFCSTSGQFTSKNCQ
jgi:hypothetical protein